jgi:hypothetical protein
MRSHQLACLIYPLAAVVFGGTARGDLLARYSFTDAVAGTLNRNATTVALNVASGSITDSPTVNGNATSVLVRTTGVGYTTQPVLSAARANFNESSVRSNVYFTFTVSPNAGYELDLSNITFNVAQGGGTALQRDYDVRSSVDGFATSLTGIVPISSVRPTFSPVSINLAAAPFQNRTSPLTFQFRVFTPTVSQNVDFDDITLNGSVTAVPEVSTLPVLAIAAVLMFVGGPRGRSCVRFIATKVTSLSGTIRRDVASD